MRSNPKKKKKFDNNNDTRSPILYQKGTSSSLLLPDELEHEVPSLSSSSSSLSSFLLESGRTTEGAIAASYHPTDCVDICLDSHHQNHNDDDDDNTTTTTTTLKYNVQMIMIFTCFVLLGVTNTVATKLQTIPMYNYPTFLNLFGNFLFVVVCFLYIIPTYYFGWWNTNHYHHHHHHHHETQNTTTTITTTTTTSIMANRDEWWSIPTKSFMIMGSLDSLAITMQVFAAVYLPGPLMVLLLQATIPISMIMSRLLLGEKYRIRQYVGALIVVLGIIIVLEPIVFGQQQQQQQQQYSTSTFVCEVASSSSTSSSSSSHVQDYCTICQVETTKAGCLSHRFDDDQDNPALASSSLSSSPSPLYIWNATANSRTHPMRWEWKSNISNIQIGVVNDTSSNDNDDSDTHPGGTPVCRWISSDDSTSRDESSLLMILWSYVIILSCLPATISSIYKQIIFIDYPNVDTIFLNGWVSLFQLVFSICLVIPSGMATTPTIQPSEVPMHLWNGLKCFMGYGSIATGCHPDNMCSSGLAALFVLFSLCSSVCYSFTILLILKYGSTALLYLALTVMVPLSNFAFSLPFLPRQAQQPPSMQDLNDFLGLLVILGGLVLFRFGAVATVDATAVVNNTSSSTSAYHNGCNDPDENDGEPDQQTEVEQQSVNLPSCSNKIDDDVVTTRNELGADKFLSCQEQTMLQPLLQNHEI